MGHSCIFGPCRKNFPDNDLTSHLVILNFMKFCCVSLKINLKNKKLLWELLDGLLDFSHPWMERFFQIWFDIKAHTTYENWDEERTPPVRVNKFSKGKGQNPDFQDITRIQPMIFFLIWFYTLFGSPKNKYKLIYSCGQWFSSRHTNETFPSPVVAVTIFFILSSMFWPDNLLQALKSTNSSINKIQMLWLDN